MASSYNVVLLVDTAEPVVKDRLRLLSLRLLNFLTCRVGLGHVRWSYRFLNSLGGRCRPPRRSDLRELGPRSWDEFEEELEACWERARSGRASTTQSSRAMLTQTALMETLSDFQWDRPDITSPTKPTLLRSRRRGRIVPVDEPMKTESPTDKLTNPSCRNAVFILSPCPHTQAQLGHFIAMSDNIGPQQVIDKLLPRTLQNIINNKKVVLYWLDTSDWSEVWSSFDHSGYWTMMELMHLVGGRILPTESLLEYSRNLPAHKQIPLEAALNIPFDSILNCLFLNESEYRLRFPQQEGTVFFKALDERDQWDCDVTLEPISVTQKHLSKMTIKLKGTVQNWNQNQEGSYSLETWVLHNATKDCNVPCDQFCKLLQALLFRGLHMVADVSSGENEFPSTGILSPISGSAAILKVICTDGAFGLDGLDLHEIVDEANEISSDLPDIVSSVLNHVYSPDDNRSTPDIPVPEWVNQELSQSSRWTSSIVERWYPLSGSTGASCNLMESFRLINAAASDQDEHLKSDQEVSNYLSEFYQKCNDESGGGVQGENQKKRGLPRTPVRQKMKTMPRALQMLNVARLNVKAQKSYPPSDGVIPAAEKNPPAKRRSSEKREEKIKPLKHPEIVKVQVSDEQVMNTSSKSFFKCKKTLSIKFPAYEDIDEIVMNEWSNPGFKSVEEMISRLKEDYKKTVSVADDSMLMCAKNTIAAIKSYLQSSGSTQVEVDCMDKIRNLLKTSKVIRQQYGNNHNKEAKLRECQIQVFLRLESCVQCPVIQTNADELEQLIEEITDMLRILSLTEDPLFVTKFLKDGVLTEYLGTLPKILADIYYGLGTQIPEDLALVLPSDGEDSVMQEGRTSQPSISRVPSLASISSEMDQLEELRTRSAKKRRSSTIARHRSVAESSQILRQIEVPKRQLNKENSQSNPVVMIEKLKLPLPAQPQKDAEAKVRRNLFVQENRSPAKRCSKMPRSHSVSAIEGLKHKRSKSHDGTKDHYKLLTKQVSETPIHKQTSNRLLHKQIKGRNSESASNISIVEESPEKDIKEIDLRRSPRIKQLAFTRRNSSFYSSQPVSRNLERVHSATQQQKCEDIQGNCLFSEVKTPKRLLFGEVLKMNSPTTRRARRNILDTVDTICQTPGKTHRKPNQNAIRSLEDSEKTQILQSSPCTPARTPKRLKTPSKSSSERKTAAKNLGKLFSPSKLEAQSTIKASGRRSERLAQMTPGKESSPETWLISPLKNTEVWAFSEMEEGRLDAQIFKSPLKTPKRTSNKSTPAKQILQTACTPTKSPFKLQISECLNSPRDFLQTPKKPGSASVSNTCTPKQCVIRELSVVLSRLKEHTPEKVLLSPRKPNNLNGSRSPNPLSDSTSINSSSRQSYNSETKLVSVCQPAFQTPRKLEMQKSGGLQVFGDASTSLPVSTQGHKGSTEAENSHVTCNVSADIQGVTSDGDLGHSENDTRSPFSIKSSMPLPVKSLSPVMKKCSSSANSPKARAGYASVESPVLSESFVSSSQTEESIDISEAVVVPTENSELKMKVLITRKTSECSLSCLSTTPKGVRNISSTSYGLRCTPDRRQREAEARLGIPEMPATFSTPKSHQRKLSPVTSTYEVELEMQASGLPKLRFKRTDSSSTVDSMHRIESPNVSKKRKGNESPFSEKWCNKHALKLDSACVSPSCLRSSHNTPGKSGLQTFICQSYTPNRCFSSASSPSHTDMGVPWTPSPKHKEKICSEVINNWPRRKKASALNTNPLRGEKNQDYTDGVPSAEEVGDQAVSENKKQASPVDEFELDGVSKLLEQSPVIEWQGKSDKGTFGLKCRKRTFDLVSPTKETQHYYKRACTVSLQHGDINLVTQNDSKEDTEICSSSKSLSSTFNSLQPSSCDDEVFNISGFTPPSKVLRNSLSASGLLSLTQSPMLYQGKTPSSKRKETDRMQDTFSEETDIVTPKLKRQALQASDSDSPFSKTVPLRTISRTYARKKLIT
ncbi:treslin [Rhinophrynus dorsalis]